MNFVHYKLIIILKMTSTHEKTCAQVKTLTHVHVKYKKMFVSPFVYYHAILERGCKCGEV